MRWELHGHLGRGKSVAGGRSWLTSHQQVLVQMKKRSCFCWIWKGLLTYTVNVCQCNIQERFDHVQTKPLGPPFSGPWWVSSGSDGHCSRVGYQGWMSCWFCWKRKKQSVFSLFLVKTIAWSNSFIYHVFSTYMHMNVYIYIFSFYLCSLLKTWISFQTQALWRFPISARLLQL